MNLIALVTLQKLIKLEFKALEALAIRLHLSTDLYGKEIAQFSNRVNEYIFNNFVEYRYDDMHSYHIYGGMREGEDFELSLPQSLSDIAKIQPLVVSTNRFVRSSFALSLVWTAKLYKALDYQFALGSPLHHFVADCCANALYTLCKVLKCEPFSDRENLQNTLRWIHL